MGGFQFARRGRFDGSRHALSGAFRRLARRAGRRLPRPRLHHSGDRGRHPAGSEPSHSGRRGAACRAVVFGLWADNHAVGRRAFAAATTGPTERLTLGQAYELWRVAQPGGPAAKKTMVLVAVQGGASRAGYWTALALSSLREAGRAKGVDLDPHLFAISSVSGGSVGSIGYEGVLRSAPDAPDFELRLLRFAGQNALGPAVTGMLFPDLLQRFLPVAFLPDRAEALERSWEYAWDETLTASGAPASASLMREPFLNLSPRAGEP